jgi:uncharacterized repeat protein (TIGR01451 family)
VTTIFIYFMRRFRWLMAMSGGALTCCLAWLLVSAPVVAQSESIHATAGSIVNQHVLTNTTWTKAGSPYTVTLPSFYIGSNATLTIEPGVVVVISPGGGFTVEGRLLAQGIPGDPILITGLTKTPGSWRGLSISGSFYTLAEANLQHVVVEYGGSKSGNGGNLIVDTAAVTLTHSIVRFGASHGIYNTGGTTPDESTRLWVSNTTFIDNAGYPIYGDDLYSNNRLQELTASGNRMDAVVHVGDFGEDHVWMFSGLPYVIMGTAYLFMGDSLTLEPGVEVRMAKNSSIVVDEGALIAVGTPSQPITITGTTQEPGWWMNIESIEGGQIILRHCSIGYGGSDKIYQDAMLRFWSSTAFVEQCRIHNAANAAIDILGQWTQPYIRNNRIEQNDFGLRDFRCCVATAPSIDARYNWWGDPSGPYHARLNPTGKGNGVNGNVLFDPWLNIPSSSLPGGLEVTIHGPGVFAPGSTQTYAVVYGNSGDTAVHNVVLALTLPSHADYVRDSKDGILWPQRNQLFWKLGTLQPKSHNLLSVDVVYDWGMPPGTKEMVLAQIGGDSGGPPGFNVAPYLAYTPRLVVAEETLSAVQVEAERQAHPQFDHLFQQALDEGSLFSVAHRLTLNTGQQTTRVILLRFVPQFIVTALWRQGENAYALVIDPTGVSVRRGGQSLRYDLQSGGWQPLTTEIGAATANSTWSDCMENCVIEKIPDRIIKKLVPGAGTVKKVITCAKAAQGDELSMAKCGNSVAKQVLKQEIPGLSDGIDLGLCNSDCQDCDGDCSNPKCYCCSEDRYLCNEGGFPYWGVHVIEKYECDTETGRYKRWFGMLISKVVQVCALCEKCVLSGNVASCVGTTRVARLAVETAPMTTVSLAAFSANQDLDCDECQVAKDPNAKYGVQGDLVPAQIVTYTITYENEGAGKAYGVYIHDRLSDHFDASSLTLYGDGYYVAASRSLFWDVGNLAPKDQPGSTGVVSFTVKLKPGLPSGTVVTNGATVYFPSVPEETPTNVVVNMIQPLVATAQEVMAVAGQPLPVTLSGMDTAGAALTFALVSPPLFGEVSGQPPNLIYTAAADYAGPDELHFTVSNGVMTSQPARVTIQVAPSPNDSSGPTVRWTSPSHEAIVAVISEPRFTDDQGVVYYAPSILIDFSEAIDATTLTTSTIRIVDRNNQLLPVRIQYDRASGQAILFLRQALQPDGLYTVSISQGVKDLVGNPLAMAHTWRFNTESTPVTSNPRLFLPVLTR